MKITEKNNFCRVFELPQSYPDVYCFDGGHLVDFKMVDWFQPIPQKDLWDGDIKLWSEYERYLKKFLADKIYLKPDRKYLLITDFGESLIFEKESE